MLILSSQSSIFLSYYLTKFLCISHLSHAYYLFLPSHSHLLHHPTNTWWILKCMLSPYYAVFIASFSSPYVQIPIISSALQSQALWIHVLPSEFQKSILLTS
jgi:hypothetical protein